MSKERLVWTTEIRKISDLIENPRNPRSLDKKNKNELLKSFKKFDYAELVAINTDNMILAGHQRVHVMKELGWLDKEIEVRVPKRTLNEKECDEYLIRSNKNTGKWDWDLLANNFDSVDLLSYGFEEKELLDGLDMPKFDIENEEDVPDLTDKKKKVCPSCGHEF